MGVDGSGFWLSVREIRDEASWSRRVIRTLVCSCNLSSEVDVVRSIEFIHRDRRYRGKVAPVPGGGPEFIDGAWFVSINGGPERRVFEAHQDDADTPEFRHRIVIATWLTEEYNRRVSGERRKLAGQATSARDRRSGHDRRT